MTVYIVYCESDPRKMIVFRSFKLASDYCLKHDTLEDGRGFYLIPTEIEDEQKD